MVVGHYAIYGLFLLVIVTILSYPFGVSMPHMTTTMRDHLPHKTTTMRDHLPHKTTTMRDHLPHKTTTLRDHLASKTTTMRDHLPHKTTWKYPQLSILHYNESALSDLILQKGAVFVTRIFCSLYAAHTIQVA